MKITKNKSFSSFSFIRKGFTLIELIVVLIITGILMGSGIYGYIKYTQEAKADQLIQQLRDIETAMNNYKRDTGAYPYKLGYLIKPGNFATDLSGWDSANIAKGNTENLTNIQEQYAGPYLKNYKINTETTIINMCITAVTGGMISAGTQIETDGSDYLTTIRTIDNKVFYADYSKKSFFENPAGNPANIYNVLTINKIEPAVAKKVYEKLNGKAFSNSNNLLTDLAQTNIKVTFPQADKYNSSKRIIYKFSESF